MDSELHHCSLARPDGLKGPPRKERRNLPPSLTTCLQSAPNRRASEKTWEARPSWRSKTTTWCPTGDPAVAMVGW